MEFYDPGTAYPAAELFLNQPIPTFGPDVEPATAIGRAAEKYPLGWWPPLGSVLASVPALLMHASHPLLGVGICGTISAAALSIAVLDAKTPGEAWVARDALAVAVAAGLEAAACAEGGAVAVSLGIFGLLIGIGAVVPRWFGVRAEAREYRRLVEVQRMKDQAAAWEAQQQRAARLAEVQLVLAPQARQVLGNVWAIDAHVDRLIATAGTGQSAIEAPPRRLELPAPRASVDDGWDVVADILECS